MKIAVIMRGLPGSGKSTFARRLVSEDFICSTDKFFVNDQGKYVFEPSKIGENHAKNFQAYCKLISMDLPPEIVVVDNTNLTRWEYEKYERAAKENGYSVVKILVGNPSDPAHQEECFKRGVHGLTLEKIRQMAARFEP